MVILYTNTFYWFINCVYELVDTNKKCDEAFIIFNFCVYTQSNFNNYQFNFKKVHKMNYLLKSTILRWHDGLWRKYRQPNIIMNTKVNLSKGSRSTELSIFVRKEKVLISKYTSNYSQNHSFFTLKIQISQVYF